MQTKSFVEREQTLEQRSLTKKMKRNLLGKRTLVASLIILLLIPATILYGIWFLKDEKYLLISFLIVVYTMVPFFMVFEKKKPQARELVVIAALAAIAVAGRSAFFMLPQFKPVVAVVIIAGVCFGPESGFLTGAVAGFVSNFFFGHGPWSPWQMFSFGIIGFLAGLLVRIGLLKKKRLPLCVFGGVTTFIIYGGLMNLASLFMFHAKFNWPTVLAIYASGFPFDMVHAIATVFFLFILSKTMIEKLDRIKKKYGLLED